MLEALNKSLFLWINATPDSPGWLITLATFVARDVIAIIPLAAAVMWLWGPKDQVGSQRVLVLKIGIALAYALTISWCLGNLFPHERPFAMGLGHQYLSHAPDVSYPSDHGTTIFTFAMAFLFWHRIWSGALLLLISGTIAWSRIYLGVHWPLDMLGGFLVAILACGFAHIAWFYCGRRLLQNISWLYRLLFAIPIRKGWVRE